MPFVGASEILSLATDAATQAIRLPQEAAPRSKEAPLARTPHSRPKAPARRLYPPIRDKKRLEEREERTRSEPGSMAE